MKRKTASLSLIFSIAHSAYGAIDILTESVSGPDEVGGPVRLAYQDDVRDSDLINEGSASLLDWTSTPSFSGGGTPISFITDYMNDGEYDAGDQKNTYFTSGINGPGDPEENFPAVVTYNLDTSIAVDGYEITSIATFFGWATQSRLQCHQNYTVEISLVGSAAYTLLATVDYDPFPDGKFEGAYESKVEIVEDVTGLLASGVDSIRFTFSDPGGTLGAGYVIGSVIREIDVVGFAVGGDPNAITVSVPAERQVIQRDSSDLGDIPVGGSFISTPDLVEARAIVKSGGENNGVGTGWQTIETAPTGGSFSGFLTDVAAGGWYEIEVRSVLGGVPSNSVTVGRVGVGDVFVCAGQSNAANQGTPAAAASSDRVSVRNEVDENSWVAAVDPLPIAEGTLGSVWTRLGDLIAEEEDVPVGFLSLARNNSTVANWGPATFNDVNLLNPGIKSFPQDGFRAFLWHQGEADGSTTAASYRDTLIGIINHSRGVSGANWEIPWYIAEASYQPSDPLSAEESTLSGQRQVAHAISNVFLAADTNDFHLEGRSSDGVHFNAAGLEEHARQWHEAIYRTAPVEVRNGDFELNTLNSLTGVDPLPDNGFAETIPSAINGPTVLDWRILRSSGELAADGASGFFNPGSETYSKTMVQGELPNVSGRHVATLRGGSAGNHFLQTLRVLTKNNKSYFLSVALGKRDVGVETYAGARVELLDGGTVLESLVVDSNNLDTWAGGSASGKFTNVTLRHDTGVLGGEAHELGIRIVKVIGGVNTYLDFDSVILSELNTSSGFVSWLNSYSLAADPNHDTDGDGLRNLVEYALGTSPIVNDAVNVLGNQVGEAIRITRRRGSVGGLAYAIESSPDLSSWTTLGGVVEEVVSTNGDFETVDLTRVGGWFPGAEDTLYYRLKVEIID